MNPYNPYSFNSMYPQTLPQQQILTANGRASVDNIKLPPNSSALIADATLPLIYKCVSDSLGNVVTTMFDVTPHKDEEQVKQEQSEIIIADLVRRIERLENESNTKWNSNNEHHETVQTNDEYGKERKQSASNGKPNNSK